MSSDLDGRQKVDGEAVVTGGDTANILQPVEHALDGITVAVRVGREAAPPTALNLGRDVGGGS